MTGIPPTTETALPETVIPVVAEYIAVKPGYCGGKPHIIGHRVKVQHIAIWRERLGMTLEEIVATYPTLSLPAVFAALAYYHSHRNEIDTDIATRGRDESKGQPIQTPRKAADASGHGRSAST